MVQVTTVVILAMTVGMSIGRPRLWSVQIDHAAAALLGVLLCVTLGVVPLAAALDALSFLFYPVITIISLMTITIIAEQTGLFTFLAFRIARLANGNAKRLFFYLFFTGTLTGTLFTNDAAVLIFTPLVFQLIQAVQGSSWTERNKLPFYFAVLYVANVAGALIISNPINIVASHFFDIAFLDYAAWMFMPAFISIIVSYLGIRLVFHNDLPDRFQPLVPDAATPKQRRAMVICSVVLFCTLLAFFSEPLTGIPTWLVALSSALLLLGLHGVITGSPYSSIAKGIGWDVIIFVTGIFVIANALSRAGIPEGIGTLLSGLFDGGSVALTHAIGFTAAGLSAVINNHPTAYLMPMVIQDMDLTAFEAKMLLFSALIGGDLGPKMLPIGSLAALMWFRMLRHRGVHVSYWLYIKIGVPVSLAAIFLAIVMLNLQVFLYGLFKG